MDGAATVRAEFGTIRIAQDDSSFMDQPQGGKRHPRCKLWPDDDGSSTNSRSKASPLRAIVPLGDLLRCSRPSRQPGSFVQRPTSC